MGEGAADARTVFRDLRRAAFERRGFSATERFIRDDLGRTTAVLERGHGGTTVLIHGGVGVTAEWAMSAAEVPGRVVIPDRPAFGASDRRAVTGGDFRAEAAAWLAELLDGLGVDRVNLVAASMGGFVAIAFATAFPHRVRRLVLTGAAGGLFADPGMFLRLWGAPVVGSLVSRMMPRDPDSVRRRAFGGYLVHPERVPDDIVAVTLAAMRIPGWGTANREILRSVTSLRGWRPSMRLDDALVSSGVPTTFILGDHDRLAAPDDMRALAARMPRAEVTVIADAGHIPHLDQPREVTAAVVAALA